MQIPPIPTTPDLEGIWRLLCLVISSVAGLLLLAIAKLWSKLNDKSAETRDMLTAKEAQIQELNNRLLKQAESDADDKEALLREVLTTVRASKRPGSDQTQQ